MCHSNLNLHKFAFCCAEACPQEGAIVSTSAMGNINNTNTNTQLIHNTTNTNNTNIQLYNNIIYKNKIITFILFFFLRKFNHKCHIIATEQAEGKEKGLKIVYSPYIKHYSCKVCRVTRRKRGLNILECLSHFTSAFSFSRWNSWLFWSVFRMIRLLLCETLTFSIFFDTVKFIVVLASFPHDPSAPLWHSQSCCGWDLKRRLHSTSTEHHSLHHGPKNSDCGFRVCFRGHTQRVTGRSRYTMQNQMVSKKKQQQKKTHYNAQCSTMYVH